MSSLRIAPGDPVYDMTEVKLAAPQPITAPTIVLHGTVEVSVAPPAQKPLHSISLGMTNVGSLRLLVISSRVRHQKR